MLRDFIGILGVERFLDVGLEIVHLQILFVLGVLICLLLFHCLVSEFLEEFEVRLVTRFGSYTNEFL